MELKNFFKLLRKYRIALITIPLITVLVTYFIVRTLPNTYESHARIATGLVERPDALVTGSKTSESQVNQQFNNIIQTMKLKKIVNQISYQLMLHDLTTKTPFHQPSDAVARLTVDEKNKAIATYKRKYNAMEELSLLNEDENKLYQLLASMDYNYEKLVTQLNIDRLNSSDFIALKFESDHPDLSAFALNTLGNEFINYYSAKEIQNNAKAVKFLDSLLRQKQLTMKQKMKALENFKVKHGILDVNDQAGTLISQIAEFEARKQEAVRNIGAYSGVLQNIDKKFDPTDRKYFESAVTEINQEAASTRDQLKEVNDLYVKSNFDPKYKPAIDSLRKTYSTKINQANDKYAYSPLTTKQDLVAQKLQYEMNLELAKNSVSSLDEQLSKLNGKLHALVPSQAAIQTIQDDIEVDSKEYIALSNKFNQTSLESNFPVKLQMVEMAMPGTMQPSKKWMLVIFAGIASLALCGLFLFGLFYFDTSVQDAQQLANTTKIPVIGTLNVLNAGALDLKQVWEKTNDTKALKEFKNQIRSIRFEIENDLNGAKVVSITSLTPDAGKTFLTLNLAFAYAIANKKVLLIDGNFDNSGISEIITPDMYLEDYLASDYNDLSSTVLTDKLVILGNRGSDRTLVEINDVATIQSKFKSLKEQFDIILVEVPPLSAHNKAKEWISVTEKLVPIFEAGQKLDDAKKQNIQYFNTLDEKMIGWVLNKVNKNKGRFAKTKKLQAIKRAEV
jgi:polysaccharide biosynthesis transport protein